MRRILLDIFAFHFVNFRSSIAPVRNSRGVLLDIYAFHFVKVRSIAPARRDSRSATK